MVDYVLTAIEKRDVKKVLQLILMPGFDINITSSKKATPLILASKLGLHTVCEKLLLLGADITSADCYGNTALHYTCCHGNINITKLLIQAGCNIHALNHDGDQPIHEAVARGNQDIVQLLIETGSDVNRPNHVTGSTPLDLATLHEQTDIVPILLKHKANVHHTSRAGETVLYFGVQVGSIAIIKQLLGAGADINLTNNLGETPLSIAIQENKENIVRYLVETGCRLDYTDYLSPLCVACRHNRQEIICYLLAQGYNVNKDTSLSRYIFLHLEETNPELMDYIAYQQKNPLTLKEVCRLKIRKVAQQPISMCLATVRIPKCLRDFVSSSDIYSNFL